MTRHGFMSPSWIAMAREQIAGALCGRDLGDEPFTLCEEFTDPPAHLLPEGAEAIGFCVTVGREGVEVGDGPRRAADRHIVSDYRDARALARDPGTAAADPAEAERRMREGRLAIAGDPTRMPRALAEVDLHRLLAARTR